MQRRRFLQSFLASSTVLGCGLAGSGRLWAATGQPDARLLLVFLRGGYDALSLLVPSQRGFYAEQRPSIAIPLATASQPGATALDADWGLHPALAPSVLPLVQLGQASFVPFAGTDNTSRSHFETQDSIELGLPGGVVAGAGEGQAGRDFHTGFLNRLAQQLQGRQAIAFTEQLPLVLRGPLDVANVSLKAPNRAADAARWQKAVQAMYREHPLQARVDASFELREQLARQLAEEKAQADARAAMAATMADKLAGREQAMSAEMLAANRGAISAKGFELEARRVARLMRERYALGFVDVGGWDTHVNQGAATGQLASRLDELGRGLAGFADEIGPAAWRSTVVVVVSEFGRTVRENGNRGTDHGHGSVYWVLGGGLSSRPVVGEQVAIEARSLHQNRDLPVLNDYRSLLAGLMQRQFGLRDGALQQVFAGVKPRDLGLL